MGHGEPPSAPSSTVVMPCAICVVASGSRSETFLGVVVDVDESGREHQALGVDHCLAPCGLEIADCGDPVIGDPNIRLAQRRPGAVRHLRVDDDGARESDDECMHGAAV